MKQFKTIQADSKQSNIVSILLTVVACAALTACATSTKQHKQSAAKENFAQSDKKNTTSAEPPSSLSNNAVIATTMPRGGGYEKVGKPYQINGRWYYPKHDEQYNTVGHASWYGRDFHGQKTANGEIFDMNHLSAAHPTMPLPSYARVTNLENGSSIVVRVNDRGPFAKDRVIDLSKRAAQLLNYHNDGVANVKVEYIGRAPIDDDDDSYLLASYQPGTGQPSMLAQTIESPQKINEPARATHPITTAPVIAKNTAQKTPQHLLASAEKTSSSSNSYAETATNVKPTIFNAVMSPSSEQRSYSIELGIFKSKSEISSLLSKLGDYGRVHISPEQDSDGHAAYRLTLSSVSDTSTALQIARNSGATNAYLVQD